MTIVNLLYRYIRGKQILQNNMSLIIESGIVKNDYNKIIKLQTMASADGPSLKMSPLWI